MGVVNAACALTEVKANKAATKTDGNKSKSIRGIPKLVDANYAGTPKSAKCCLIFCEGDWLRQGLFQDFLQKTVIIMVYILLRVSY